VTGAGGSLAGVTRIDLVVVAVVAVAALLGFRRGMVGSALSAAGLIVGAILGARVAPHLLSGDDSPYTPLVALAGGAVGAMVFESIGTLIGRAARRSMTLPPLRALDSAGGLVLGAATGLALAWVAGAVALHLPGQTELRRDVQASVVLQRLNEIVPPSRLMEAIERVDPFPAIAGPLAPVDPPDARVLRMPGVRAAAASVVRVVGNACGLAISGSGWVARPGLVVTAAHVVAGQTDTHVDVPGGRHLDADAVAFDARNDIAVLRVRGLHARPLRLGDTDAGIPVAILGYPESGPFTAAPGRLGRTAVVITDDAYGRGPVRREVTSLRGKVRHGNSGGPAVDGGGAVATTVFASRVGTDGGYGVPLGPIRKALDAARRPVSTGECVH
jgi:S1-C subfamily serine protease